jgi:hypothetical protein
MRTITARFCTKFWTLAAMGLACWAAATAHAETPRLKPSLATAGKELIPVKAPQTARTRATGAAATITFSNIGLDRAEPSNDDLEVILRFDGPFDPKLADQITNALPEWIAFATPGYDSLLIRTKKKAAFSVDASPAGFDLRFAWAADPDAALRHNAQTLRTLTASGETHRARAMLQDMRRTSAPPAQLDRAEAELQLAERNPRRALQIYEHLASQEPDDAGLRKSIDALEYDLSDWVEAGLLHQSVKDGDTQTRYGLRGLAAISSHSSAEIEIETVALSDDAVLRTDGSIGPVDANPVRLRAALETDEGSGFLWTAAIHVGEPGLGVAAAAEWRGARQDVTLRASYNEPFFGFVEAIAGAGARDAIEATWRLRGAQHWRTELGARYVRYGLDGVEDAATALGVQAFAAYDIPVTDETIVTLGYGLDAEYVDSIAIVTDAFGTLFAPLPLLDREVHSLSAGIVAPVTAHVAFNAVAGYAYDRYAEGGIFARAGFDIDLTPAWALAAAASYAEINSRGTGGGAVSSAGLTLRYRTGGPGTMFGKAKRGGGA